jgi:UDP-4-amino-4-deoxy-L-arabinose formyltransferase/UDP-glucuronic acid dehydrogenase (UDP-4-keto-hexauronic acid decarboxylating)
LKIILCGYNKIGCDVLKKISKMNCFNDIFLFTHKPLNNVPDIISVAKDLGIKYTKKSINKVELPFKPDIISSVYYRYIVKQHVIDLCNGKIFNVHPSLLPNHRGCSAVPWSIIDGDTYSGITYHYIDKEIDTGNIIFQISTLIDKNETQKSLYDRLMKIGFDYWEGAFRLVECGFEGCKQVGKGKYHNRGVPYNGEIDDKWSNNKIERFIRAMIYPPYKPASYKGINIYSINQYKKI